jgi:hypothetical protein
MYVGVSFAYHTQMSFVNSKKDGTSKLFRESLVAGERSKKHNVMHWPQADFDIHIFGIEFIILLWIVMHTTPTRIKPRLGGGGGKPSRWYQRA